MKSMVLGKQKQNNPLAKSFTFFSLVRFALPTIGTMFIYSLYTVIDGIFIAQYAGENALAASNIVYPGVNLLLGVAIMFGAGGSAVVAKTLGEKNPVLASRRFTLLLSTALTAGVLMAAMGFFFLDPILSLLGATDLLWEDCRAYLEPMIIFAPIIVVKFVFDSFFVTAGRPELGFYLSIASGIMNVVLDYVLLDYYSFGVGGAAYATVAAYSCSAVAGLIYFLNKRSILSFSRFSFEPRTILQAMSNGSAQMVNQLSVGVTTFLFNILTLRYAGEDGVAAITIIFYAEMLLTAVYIGYTSGVAPIFSFHFGARNDQEIRSLVRKSLSFIALAAVVSFVSAQVFAGNLVQSFAPEGSPVYAIALPGFRLFALSFLFCGFNLFTPGFFTAISAGRASAFCSCARDFVAISGYLLLLPMFFGLNGIWLAVPAADATILGLSFYLLHDFACRKSSAALEVRSANRRSALNKHLTDEP